MPIETRFILEAQHVDCNAVDQILSFQRHEEPRSDWKETLLEELIHSCWRKDRIHWFFGRNPTLLDKTPETIIASRTWTQPKFMGCAVKSNDHFIMCCYLRNYDNEVPAICHWLLPYINDDYVKLSGVIDYYDNIKNEHFDDSWPPEIVLERKNRVSFLTIDRIAKTYNVLLT